MHGSLWIGKWGSPAASLPVRRTDLDATESLGTFLAVCAIGLAAGAASACLRLHLGLPGHKVLVWLTPVMAARLVSRSPLGGTGGTLSAALGAMAAGGELAGPASFLPVTILAGMLMDAVIGLAERRRLAAGWVFVLAAVGGLTANSVLAIKRLLTPVFTWHAWAGLSEVESRLLSYALFGALAGVLGAALAWAIKRKRLRR